MNKAGPGNFFEDFRLGFEFRHPTPRTVTEGDLALHAALYGSRFATTNSVEFARSCGFERLPADDLLVFDLVLSRGEPDVAPNRTADLGYAAGRFGVPVLAGDTLYATSRVVGLEGNGTVHLRTRGFNQQGETVLDVIRRMLIGKRDPNAEAPPDVVPQTPAFIPPDELVLPMGLNFSHYDPVLAGSPYFWEDYTPGETIDHRDSVPYGSNARLIDVIRALTFNGLGNAVKIAAINDIRPLAPCAAGDRIHAWSRVEESWELPGRPDLGALRITSFATQNRQPVLEFDYTVLMPRRS